MSQTIVEQQQEQLRKAIEALENQREMLGQAIVDSAVAALYEKIASLKRDKKTPERQRKQVSVLFADISGFTTLSEKMDAEDISDLVNGFWKRIDRIILSHGGWIDKHIGDAVMALWGVETAREDDPEQAILAALTIQDMLLEESHWEESQAAAKLQLRVAVHTGPVLLGETGATGEFTAIGDTVNTASRLQSNAPLGGVIISQATHQQVRGLFDVLALKPIPVKGKSKPLQAYQVLQAKPRDFQVNTRGLEGVTTHMIGREAELSQLQQALKATSQASQCQMVTIEGEAGVGKSRLLYEFEAWVRSQSQSTSVFRGRATPDTQNRPYALLRDLFAHHLQIQESDTLTQVWQKLESGLGNKMQAHFIGQMLGYDFTSSSYLKESISDARQLRNRATTYLVNFFRAASRSGPVLLFLDDLHWSDDSSLDALDTLLRSLAQTPLLAICLTRPTLFERHPSWGKREGQTQIKLTPLSRDDSLRLTTEILQKLTQIPDTLKELLLNNSEGNPYYMEELVRMLIDEGVILQQAECWEIDPGRLQEMRIPATLTGILQARLDSLPEGEHKTLQRSSVVGRTFWDRVLENLEGEQPARLKKSLLGLQQRELVFPQPDSAFAGTREFTFNHAILHDVTYESVLKRDRRRYHEQIAHWLIAQSGQRVGEYSGLIADHLEKAGQTHQAVVYLRQAGEMARQTFANIEAVGYFTRALALLEEENPVESFNLLLARESIYDLQGNRVAQENDLAKLEELSVQLDTFHQAQTALRRASFALVTGDFPAAEAAARHAAKLAQSCGEAGMQSAALVTLGQSFWRMGKLDEAQQHLEQALSLAQSVQADQTSADALRAMGNLASDRNQKEQAVEYFIQSIDICRRIGNRGGESAALNSLGIVYRAMGDGARCHEAYLRTLQTAQEMGDRRMESGALVNLGVWHRSQSDYFHAIEYYEKALSIQREIEDPHYESATLTNLAVAYQHQGDLIKSWQHYRQALEIKRRIGDQRGEGMALTGLGGLALKLGLYEQAREHLSQSLQIKKQLNDKRGETIVLTNLSAYARKTGAHSLGIEYAQQSLALARQLSSPTLEADANYEMGLCFSATGQFEQAIQALRQSTEIWRDLGETNHIIECQAHLAWALYATEHNQEAVELVNAVLQAVDECHTDDNPCAGLIGADNPITTFFNCYQVLHANVDPRAFTILEITHQLLQDQLTRIEDPNLRHSYLNSNPEYRAILDVWGKRNK